MPRRSGKLKPNLDHSSTPSLNLTVLQRFDPSIEEILLTAAHAVFYKFNTESYQWSRKDVEGSLFVVKRNAQPRFQFIVMNRKNEDILVENLVRELEYEVQGPYLLYRNAVEEINGIWFFNAGDCDNVFALFSRIINALPEAPPDPKVSSSISEVEELEAAPSNSVTEPSLEPSSTASTSTDSHQDPSILHVFREALGIKSDGSTEEISKQHFDSSLPVQSSTYSVVPSDLPTPQETFNHVPPLSTPNLITGNNQITNLVKPTYFFTPHPSSSMPPFFSSMLPTPLNFPESYRSPLPRHFPAPPHFHDSNINLVPVERPLISRHQVRETLLSLSQDDGYIELFYQALLKVCER